jgi:hypothetical protein
MVLGLLNRFLEMDHHDAVDTIGQRGNVNFDDGFA